MRAIRRIYLYAVSLVSLEVTQWGLIGLLRTVIELGPECTFSNLSLALALILVGAPLFALHWWWAERLARTDEDERPSLVRAGFLYGLLLGTLIPASQNLLALINRGLVQGTLASICQPLIGGEQTWPDNLTAIFLNLVVAGAAYAILRRDRHRVAEPLRYIETRRFFRFVWTLYGLGLTIYGVNQIVRFLLFLPADLIGSSVSVMLVDGAALILVGAPIWITAWNACQAAMLEKGEADSKIRRTVLYLLALVGVPFALVMLDDLLTGGLLALLGQPAGSPKVFLQEYGSGLSLGLPFAVVWAYYGSWLFRDLRSLGSLPRRGEWRRPYLFILSAAGLIVSMVAITQLFNLLGDLFFFQQPLGIRSLAGPLGRTLALLLTGLPLWLVPWGSLQAEAGTPGEAGDHARRSVLRKIYLYTAAFALLVGAMITAVQVLTYLLEPVFISSVLAERGFELFSKAGSLALDGVLLAYHLVCLRRDGPRLGAWLSGRQEEFPVLVVDPGPGGFSDRMTTALRRQAPLLPVTILPAGGPLPAEKLATFQAVILPSSLMVDPPEGLRRWLKKYPGNRIVVAEAVPGWILGGLNVEQAARVASQLAEGQEVRLPSPSTPLLVLLYLILGLVGLVIITNLISSLPF